LTGKQVGCWLANNLFTRLLLIGIAAKPFLFEFANNLSTRQLLIEIAAKPFLFEFANNLLTRQLVYSLTLSPPCVAVVSNNN